MNNTNVMATVLFTVMLISGLASYANKALILFTAEEAKHLDFADEEIQIAKEFSLSSLGPRINILSSQKIDAFGENIFTLNMNSSTDLIFEFEPGEYAVDMSSFELSVKKLDFSIDLTPRLASFIKGNKISIKNLHIPVGHFKLSVKIADVRKNTHEALLIVKSSF